MNSSLQKKTSLSLLWNAGEAFLYQGFLLTHQLLLFSLTSKELYGSLGALFASLYFGIMILNGSFDTALVSRFSLFSQNKQSFKTFIINEFLPQISLLLCGGLTLLTSLFYMKHLAPSHIQTFLTPYWVLLLTAFIFLEGTKKNLRSLLHLAFKSKTTACIEVANIICYVSLVWIYYFTGNSLSPLFLTQLFVSVSLVTTIMLALNTFYYYQTLTDKKVDSKEIAGDNKARLYIYANQICRSLFSSNFLLPFFAFHAGFKEAGIITLINTITFSTTFFIQKIFGPTSAALFASTKNLSFESKQSAFSFIHKKCLHAFYAVLLLFFINGYHLFYATQKIVSFHILILVTLFFCAHILETLFIVYEKLFIAEEKSHYILICNLISFFSCLVVSYFITDYSLIITLLCFMIIRGITFCTLTLLAKKIWNLSHATSLSSSDIATPLIFSLFLSVILKVAL